MCTIVLGMNSTLEIGRALPITALGICDCGEILNVCNYPGGSIDETWKCPGCKKQLTPEHFGNAMEQDPNNPGQQRATTRRERYVAPNKRWTHEVPASEFFLKIDGVETHITIPKHLMQ